MNRVAFEYWMPTKIHYGEHSLEHLKDEIQGNNIFILISRTLYKNGTAENIKKILCGKEVTFFYEIEPDPSTNCVNKAVERARNVKATTIVGIGGGSCIDVSKAVACLANKEGSIEDYISGKVFEKRETKLILIPTTAGTGSEVTSVGVYTDSNKGVKKPLVNSQFYADVAIIDPVLTYTTPPKVTANTGMDAFAHALESYWNANSNPISDALAMNAMNLILNNIEKAYIEPDNKAARQNMMLASLLAGLAFTQTRTTGSHVLSYPISAMFHCTHGEACAVTLPAFIRISHELASNKMMKLEFQLNYQNEHEFAVAIEKLLDKINMPNKLSQLGVHKDDIEKIANDAMNYKNQLDLTPATMDVDSLKKLMYSIL
ncbi:iron-containing alcohol dehydrogenase [Amedibacillus sp. YH-ame6]